jgi:hypothetical protein
MSFNGEVFGRDGNRFRVFFRKTFEFEIIEWYGRGTGTNKEVVISSSAYKGAGQAVSASVPKSLSRGL